MKRRMNKRMAAAALAGAMVLSMNGMAWADPATDSAPTTDTEVSTQNLVIKKKILKDENVYVPKADFEFGVIPSTEQTGLKDEEGNALKSPENGVMILNRNITSTPGADDIGKKEVIVGSTEISIDATKFEHPGVYRYEIKEVKPADITNGVGYTDEVKYFDVYIEYDENGSLVAKYYTCVTADDSKVKDDGIFENTYKKDTEEVDGGLHDLTITKTVEGNQADRKREFNFSITISGEEEEQYYLEIINSNGESEAPLTLVSGTTVGITLAHNDSAVIHGLDSNDTYVITEEDLSSENYTTSYNVNDGSDIEVVIDKMAHGEMGDTDKSVNFVNEKNVTTPTGIAMTFAPYVLLVAAAGGLGAVVLGKKKREDDEI